MAKKNRFEEEEPGNGLHEENQALAGAINAFRAYWRPTPEGQQPGERYTTEKILMQFNGIFQGLCTPKELHDALVADGYRYEYNGSGFSWLLTRA